jgi:2,5-diketo-D-gluconate reductase A
LVGAEGHGLEHQLDFADHGMVIVLAAGVMVTHVVGSPSVRKSSLRLAKTGIAPVVNQFELHPYFANTDACEASRRHGVAVEAHSPLGHNREPLTDDTIVRIAKAHGKSTAQVILRWHLQHGHIAIPKSTRPERMRENITVFDFELAPEEMASIDALDRGARDRVGPNPDTYEG